MTIAPTASDSWPEIIISLAKSLETKQSMKILVFLKVAHNVTAPQMVMSESLAA